MAEPAPPEVADPTYWYDVFWENLPRFDENGVVRVLGELFRYGVIERDGDDLDAGTASSMHLTPEDQLLVRRIEDAVNAANTAVGEA